MAYKEVGRVSAGTWTCTIYDAIENNTSIGKFAICRGGRGKRGKPYREVVIPVPDFSRCSPYLFLEKYNLPRYLVEKLTKTCIEMQGLDVYDWFYEIEEVTDAVEEIAKKMLREFGESLKK